MSDVNEQDKFPLQRRGKWQYHPRIPSRLSHVDKRRFLLAALHTKSKEAARLSRDGLVLADDTYWQALSEEASSIGEVTPKLNQHMFISLDDAQDSAPQWLWTYNYVRPNRAIGGITHAQKIERHMKHAA